MPFKDIEKRRQWGREYEQRPEVKARRKEYREKHNQEPEVKEAKKKYQKEYNQRPEVKVRKKEWSKEYSPSPEVKARKKERDKKYNQTPEGKAVRLAYTKSETGIKKRREALWKRQKININYEKYELMLEEQNYCCAICYMPQDNLKIKLAVDHNHKTGKIRGLLCSKCNGGISTFKDNIDIFKNVKIYLEQENG